MKPRTPILRDTPRDFVTQSGHGAQGVLVEVAGLAEQNRIRITRRTLTDDANDVSIRVDRLSESSRPLDVLITVDTTQPRSYPKRQTTWSIDIERQASMRVEARTCSGTDRDHRPPRSSDWATSRILATGARLDIGSSCTRLRDAPSARRAGSRTCPNEAVRLHRGCQLTRVARRDRAGPR